MSAPWFILPGTCVAFNERRLFWAHTRRSFASVQSHFETSPPWLFMYDTTDLLSERITHSVPECPAGRIDRPDTLLAFLGSWCAGPTPLRTTGRRSVCPCTALPNPCWKHLSWQPSFCAPFLGSRLALGPKGPGLIHRPESPLRVASMTPGHGWNPLLQPELVGSQTQLKYRQSHSHKAQHSLESLEQTGGTFLEGGRVALNCHGSLHWDSCCHLHWVNNYSQERNSLAGWQYALGKVDPEPQAI